MPTKKELDLHIRQGSRIMLKFPEQEQSIKTQVLGFSRDEFILVRFPYIPGILSKIQIGQDLVARYLYEGTVFGFKAYILNYVKKPVPLLFLDFPVSVEVLDLRQNKRIQCHMPTQVYLKDGEFEAMIVDLSKGGCKVFMQGVKKQLIDEIQIDEFLTLKFYTYPAVQEVQLMGYVKNKTVDKNNITLGVRFDSDGELLQPVMQFIDKMDQYDIHLE